jgi:Zn-dependent peptidase ImmA (M78 family)/transcriptional regulator with XRE-family HTH domain
MSTIIPEDFERARRGAGGRAAGDLRVVDGRGTFASWPARATDVTEFGARSAAAAFDRSRLRLARDARGLSQRELADAAGITGPAVSQFESGSARPSATTVEALAKALQVPSAFFAGSDLVIEEKAPAFFRSLRSTTSRSRRMIRARAELVHLFVQGLERYITLPEQRVPRYEVSPEATADHVESIAAAVRRDWNLPKGPIDDVVRTIERAGVVAVRMPVETEKVDAFSVLFRTRPIVVLGDEKGKRDRSRFDASHELAHLVLHDGEVCGSKPAEDQANWFAAAFLMPGEEIVDDLHGVLDWDRLIRLKGRWQVSMGALLRRKHRLGLLSHDGYVAALKQMSARGWTRDEPVPLGPPERPTLVPKAISMLADAGITLAEIADMAALGLEDVQRIVGATGPGRLAVSI